MHFDIDSGLCGSRAESTEHSSESLKNRDPHGNGNILITVVRIQDPTAAKDAAHVCSQRFCHKSPQFRVEEFWDSKNLRAEHTIEGGSVRSVHSQNVNLQYNSAFQPVNEMPTNSESE